MVESRVTTVVAYSVYQEKGGTGMTQQPGTTTQPNITEDLAPLSISHLPDSSQLKSGEQIRNFELLRLAFFALKQRKLEQNKISLQADEYEERSNLLSHAIFQQLVTLTELGAREQAMQIIEACRQ